MKRIFQWALFFSWLASLPAWGLICLEYRPGLGVDVGVVKQEFYRGFGEEHFREHYPYANFYFSLRLHRYFGLELGYQEHFRQQKDQFYVPLQPALGFIDPADLNQKLFISDAVAKGFNFNLVGYWPLCVRYHTELMGILGLARMNMTYSTTLIEDGNAANPIATWESGKHTLPRLGLGLKQPITPHFGTRVLALWQKGNKLDASFLVPVGLGGDLPSDVFKAKPKNNYIISLGFYFELDSFH